MPMGSTGSQRVKAVSRATAPMNRPSAERRRKAYCRNPTKRTMKDAPRREPLIMAKASISEMVWLAKRLREMAATGDPLMTP